jgi:hypothetical protein
MAAAWWASLTDATLGHAGSISLGTPLMPNRRRAVVGATLLLAASLLWAFCSQAQQSDPLGSVDSAFIPIPAPSTETTVRSFVMGGQRYDIPRNFLFSVENNNDGSTGAISMRALLPDIVGLKRETFDCWRAQSACKDRVVTIGLVHNPPAATGSQLLENLKSVVFPERFAGPCDLEFYETKGNESQRFQYFIKVMTADTDVSVLRCAKEGSSYAPICVSTDNPVDQISFYYNFDRKFICDWEGIRNKIRSRIASFRNTAPK